MPDGKGQIQPPRTPLPPTCGFCGGLGHREQDHDTVAHTTVPLAVLKRHIADLRAMAAECRESAGPLATLLHVARMSRAEAYEMVADRLEKEGRSVR